MVLDVQFPPDVDIPCPDCSGTRYAPAAEDVALPTAKEALAGLPRARWKLQTLIDLGLGYLTLGEDTPALSALDRLLAKGATIVVIENDLDLIANADHVIDMGSGGGAAGGRIVATGVPDDVAGNPVSSTGRYLGEHLRR